MLFEKFFDGHRLCLARHREEPCNADAYHNLEELEAHKGVLGHHRVILDRCARVNGNEEAIGIRKRESLIDQTKLLQEGCKLVQGNAEDSSTRAYT